MLIEDWISVSKGIIRFHGCKFGLADIYAVIAYYLRHQEDLEAYLEEREQRAQEVRQHIEHHQGELADLRSRLLARQRSG